MSSSMVQTGTFRVYFNRHGAAPLLWCVALVDDSDIAAVRIAWEIAVRHVDISVPCWTVFVTRKEADEDTGLPSAWITCRGMLTVAPDGTASVSRPADV